MVFDWHDAVSPQARACAVDSPSTRLPMTTTIGAHYVALTQVITQMVYGTRNVSCKGLDSADSKCLFASV